MVALGARALMGVAGLSTSSAPVNGAWHAAQDLTNCRFPIAGVFYSFDTVWSTHNPELEDFAGVPYITAPATGQVAQRVLHVCWQPSKTSGAVLLAGATGSGVGITGGAYDAHIDQMLAGMRAYPGQVVVRWGHEMNGNFYVWSAAWGNWGGTGTKANPGCFSTAEYVNAWRYIVNRARAQNTNNVKWFWCPNETDNSNGAGTTYTLESYYPGDAYVDYAGFDAYNAATPSWKSPDETWSAVYNRVVAVSTRPVWIGETGCAEPSAGQLTSAGAAASKATWINQMFDTASFPALIAVNYFDVDKSNAGRYNWTFGTSAGASAAAKARYSGAARATALTDGYGTLPYSTATAKVAPKARFWNGTVWVGYGGTQDVTPPTPTTDPFVLRTTKPLYFGHGDVRNNVGCRANVGRVNYAGAINFANGPVSLSNLNITSLQSVVGAGHRFDNCYFTGSYSGDNGGGVVACTSSTVSDLRFDFCEVEPAVPGDRYNGIYGHDFTFSRGVVTKTVDGFGVYTAVAGGETLRPVNVHIEGSWIGYLSWWKDDRNSAPNGHPDGSHNDGVQWGSGTHLYIIGSVFNHARYNGDNPGNVVINEDESFTVSAGNGVNVLAFSTAQVVTNPQSPQILLGQHSNGIIDYLWFEDNWLINGDNGLKLMSNSTYLGTGAHRAIANVSFLRNKYQGVWRDQGGAYHAYPGRWDSNVTVNGVKRAGGTYVDTANNTWTGTPPPQYFAGQSIFQRIDAVAIP